MHASSGAIRSDPSGSSPRAGDYPGELPNRRGLPSAEGSKTVALRDAKKFACVFVSVVEGTPMLRILIMGAALCIFAESLAASAATAPGTYRLRTSFTGYNKCLDIVNDGWDNRPTMATCGNYTGQAWIIEAIGTGGYSRLRTEFTGRYKCLDIVNDGSNNRLRMDSCGNYSGQKWTVEPTGNFGFARLRTAFTGSRKCLDIINDGRNNRLIMDTCGYYTGQMWKLTNYHPASWGVF